MSKVKRFSSPEDEYLGLGKSFAYGLQHVLTMYGGIVAPPPIVGTAVGLSQSNWYDHYSFFICK